MKVERRMQKSQVQRRSGLRLTVTPSLFWPKYSLPTWHPPNQADSTALALKMLKACVYI